MAQRSTAGSSTTNPPATGTSTVVADAAALSQLRADPTMATLVERFGAYAWRLGEPYQVLVRAIVGQLISGAAARAVHSRLEAATDLDPKRLLACSVDDLLTLGVPRRKGEYLRGLSAAYLNGALEGLAELPDAEVVARLTALRGVGVWTAEMFLIFALGRSDVWPLQDMGVVRAGEGLYGAFGAPALAQLGERFAPYRSAAVWYLWRWIEAGGVRPRRGSAEPPRVGGIVGDASDPPHAA
jgi:DNA-3-methyladenine glycosylase II